MTQKQVPQNIIQMGEVIYHIKILLFVIWTSFKNFTKISDRHIYRSWIFVSKYDCSTLCIFWSKTFCVNFSQSFQKTQFFSKFEITNPVVVSYQSTLRGCKSCLHIGILKSSFFSRCEDFCDFSKKILVNLNLCFCLQSLKFPTL